MNITDIYTTDSCYYYTACHGTVLYTESEIAFGKLDLDGNIVFQYTYQQGDTANFPNRTYAQMEPNFRGNFIITHSTSQGQNGWFPRLMEIDPSGNLINDFELDYTRPDSTSMGDNGLMIIDNSDSTYNIAYTYLHRNYDNNPPGPQFSMGAIVMKIDQYGDSVWTKKYNTPASVLNGFNRYQPIVFTSINDSVNLLISREFEYSGSIFQDANNWCKMHFLWLDKSGNTIETKTMQKTQVCLGGSAFMQLVDNSMIYVYDDSYLYPWSPSVDNFKYIPLMARLDHDLNILWKDTLRQFSVSNFGYPDLLRKIEPVDENSFVYGYGRSTYQDSTSGFGTIYARMGKRNISGEVQWNRNFYFYPDTLIDTQHPATYQIYDIETTSDGGYIMAGIIRSTDSIAIQVPSEFGYVVKTNCLGFIGSPSASVQVQNLENLEVQFTNTSTEAGSFDWYFGDGTHITVGEHQTTFTHQYLTFGPHSAMLIAHGCDGEADTLYFEVNPVQHFDPSVVTEGQGFFSIFPNPITAGNYLFIYLNDVNLDEENLNMRIFSNDGKLVSHFNLNAMEGNHILSPNLGTGMYHAVLYQGDKLLQERKFVVL
jgi:hypothetical protein